jgi:hypothetical protein
MPDASAKASSVVFGSFSGSLKVASRLRQQALDQSNK